MPDLKALVNLGQAALGYRDAAIGALEVVMEHNESEVPLSVLVAHVKAIIDLADAKYNAAREIETRLPKLRKVRF